MNKFDKLSLYSDEKDENVVVSVIEPTVAKPVQTRKSPTIYTTLMANFKQEKELLYPSKGANLPNLKGTISTFSSLIFLSAVMVALWYLVDKVLFIPLALAFLSLAIPVFLMVFYYEFDMGHTLPLGKLFLLVIIGALSYVVLSQISSEILYLMLNESFVSSTIMPIITNVVMFGIIFVVTSFFKSDSVRDYILVVCFLIMGYVVCESFVKGFSSLFVSTKTDGGYLYNLKVIVDNEEFLEESMKSLMSNWLYDFVALPFLYSCWGTIYAYLIYYLADSKRKKREFPKSMYLLIFLVIMLDIFAKMDTSMTSFNVILRVVSVMISVYLLIKLLNFSLEEEPPKLLKKKI